MSTVFFTDRDLGKQFPEALIAAGFTVEPHRNHFPDTCPDEIWIREIALRGWVAISHDRKIRRHPNERDAVLGSGARLLVMVGRRQTSEHARTFCENVARIEAFVAKHRAPWIAGVYAPSPRDRQHKKFPKGRIELWCS